MVRTFGGEDLIDFIRVILARGLELILRPGTPIELGEEISSECSVIEQRSEALHELSILSIAVDSKEIG